MVHIYLDAMGGDNAPQCTVEGALEALEVLRGVDDIGIVRLSHRDVVRHELVQAIVRAYERRQAASPRSTGERRFAPKR